MDPVEQPQSIQQPQSVQSPPLPVPPSPSTIPKILLIIFALLIVTALTAGAYIFGTKQNQSQPIQKQQTTMIPTPTLIELLKGLNIYTSNTFSFKYPPDWKLTQIDSSVKLEKITYPTSVDKQIQPYTNSITISITPLQQSMSLNDFFTKDYGNDKVLYDIEVKNIKKIKVSDIDALQFEIPGASGYYTMATLFIYNNVGYNITTIGLDNWGGSNIGETFQTLLSTFKFTNQNQANGTTDTSFWKIYTNTKYNISFKYPPTLYYKDAAGIAPGSYLAAVSFFANGTVAHISTGEGDQGNELVDLVIVNPMDGSNIVPETKEQFIQTTSVLKEKNITVSGLPARYDSNYHAYSIWYNDKMQVNLNPYGEGRNYTDQMVSSMQINPVQ